MKITVKELITNSDATLSAIFIDGVFECFGLEDEYRENKVASETRIPKGIYKVKVKTIGGFHSRYLSKFPNIHRGMLHVVDVPGFTDILIHIGNTDEDTAGCLLVGASANTGAELTIGSSTTAYISLYEKVIEQALVGNLTIEYDRVR